MEDSPETFGARLHRLADSRHMSMSRLAELIGVHHAQTTRWGGYIEPSIHAQSAVRLAEALHCSVDYLLLGEESPYTGKHKEGNSHASLQRAIRSGSSRF